MGRPHEIDVITLLIQGFEKGNAVKMIPMRVRDKQPAVKLPGLIHHQMTRQITKTGSRIKDEVTIKAYSETDGGSTATIFQGVPPADRQGPPDAPEVEIEPIRTLNRLQHFLGTPISGYHFGSTRLKHRLNGSG